MKENNYTVYLHISPSNKRYYGITCLSPKKRWNNGKGYKTQQYFYRAIEKYGWGNFEHIIIVKGLDEETAKWLEIELIKEHNTTNSNYGYNVTEGGDGHRGINPLENMTEEAKKERSRKISEAKKDKSLLDYLNEEEIEQWKHNLSIAFSGKNNPMYGKNPRDYMTEEAKKERDKKQSETMKGRNPRDSWTEETKKSVSKKQSEKMKGKYTGKDNPTATSVICLTTKEIFYTATEGAKYYNCDNSTIRKCCIGKRKSCGKLSDGTPLVWRYITIIEL